MADQRSVRMKHGCATGLTFAAAATMDTYVNCVMRQPRPCTSNQPNTGCGIRFVCANIDGMQRCAGHAKGSQRIAACINYRHTNPDTQFDCRTHRDFNRAMRNFPRLGRLTGFVFQTHSRERFREVVSQTICLVEPVRRRCQSTFSVLSASRHISFACQEEGAGRHYCN
jgi:hypothetical protein